MIILRDSLQDTMKWEWPCFSIWVAGLYFILWVQPIFAQNNKAIDYIELAKDFESQALQHVDYYDSALMAYREAHRHFVEENSLRKELIEHAQWNVQLRTKGYTEWAARKLDSVLNWLVFEELPSDQRGNYAWLCIQNGYNHYQIKSYIHAIRLYDKGLAIFRDDFKSRCPDKTLDECILSTLPDAYQDLWSYIYRPLINLHIKIGDFYTAQTYLPPWEVLKVHEKKLNPQLLFNIYSKYGDVKLLKGDTLQAYSLFQQASNLNTLTVENQARSLLNDGNAARLLTKYEDAQIALSKALKIVSEADLAKDIHFDTYMFLAYLERDQGKAIVNQNPQNDDYKGYYQAAQAYYQQALSLVQSSPVEVISLEKRAHLQWNLGELQLFEEQYPQAIKYFQACLQMILPDDSEGILPDIKDLQPKPFAIYALEGLADCWTQEYQQSNQLSHLTQAAQAHQLILAIEDSLRGFYYLEEARLERNKLARKRLSKAMNIAYALWERAPNEQAIQLALSLIEKSRAMELRASLKEAELSQQFEIPDTLLQSIYLAKWAWDEQQQRLDSLSNLRGVQQETLQQEERHLDEYRNHFFSLNRELAQKYPAYYRQKFAVNAISLEQIQAQLSSGEVMLAYFWGEEAIYSLMITKDSYDLQRELIDRQFSTQLDAVVRFVQNPNPSIPQSKTYEQHAYALYQKLLNIPEDWGINSLIIIPDQQLSYLPFEALTTEIYEGNAAFDFRHFAFLWQKYLIRYSYVPTMLVEKQEAISKADYAYTGFAPTYEAGGGNTNDKSRQNLSELTYNKAEVEQAYALFKNQDLPSFSFANETATEAHFREFAPQSNILHVAMHSYGTDSSKNSLIFGTQEAENDGRLQLSEIYLMKLRAELLVLSACKTALGRLELGEGLMSLGRAFRMTGCRNIVTSLWNVDDESSSVIVSSFFEYLKKGQGKAEALRLAKGDYFNNEDLSRSAAAPYYWAQFVLVGNNEVLAFSSEKPKFWPIAIGILIIVLLGSFFLYRYAA